MHYSSEACAWMLTRSPKEKPRQAMVENMFIFVHILAWETCGFTLPFGKWKMCLPGGVQRLHLHLSTNKRCLCLSGVSFPRHPSVSFDTLSLRLSITWTKSSRRLCKKMYSSTFVTLVLNLAHILEGNISCRVRIMQQTGYQLHCRRSKICRTC